MDRRRIADSRESDFTEEIEEMIRSGLITMNDGRKMMGLPPVPGGNQWPPTEKTDRMAGERVIRGVRWRMDEVAVDQLVRFKNEAGAVIEITRKDTANMRKTYWGCLESVLSTIYASVYADSAGSEAEGLFSG